jgi:hypothetical protein
MLKKRQCVDCMLQSKKESNSFKKRDAERITCQKNKDVR